MLPTLGRESGFVVKNIQASFLSTATLGDILDVTTTILTLKHTSLTLLQEIWRDDRKLFSMKVVLVYINRGKPCRIPQKFKTLFTENHA